MTRASPALSAAFLCLLGGCREVERAPEDLDELMSFAFTRYDGTGDAAGESTLADAGNNLLRWYEANVEDDKDAYRAELLRLSDDDLAVLDPLPQGGAGPDALGILVIRQTACTLADIDAIYLDSDQRSFFPDAYESYERRDMADFGCYRDGDCGEATWFADTVQSNVGITYTFALKSGLRQVLAPLPDAEAGDPDFAARFSRTHMLDKAELSNDDLGEFRQNYQLEVMIPREGGVLHVYGQWTELFIDGINTEGDYMMNQYMDGLEDYMSTLEQSCAGI